MLEWKRARRHENDVANQRIFETRCKRYHVIESIGKFVEMGIRWYAILLPHTILSNKARSKAKAQQICEDHLNPPPPKKKRRRKKKK